MDVTTMTLEELETALDEVIEMEDVLGRPDILTEDWIKSEIACRKKADRGPSPAHFAKAAPNSAVRS